MIVMPALDIKGGKCVQLVGGKPGTEQVQIDDVMGVARMWQEQGCEMLHIVDLDSALGTGDNERQIEMVVADLSIPVQVGGGIRSEDKVHRLFEIGCERVVVGTRAIEDRAFIEGLSNRYTDGIVVALDAASRKVMIKGWQESSGKDVDVVLKDLEPLPFWGYLYTNVDVEGRLQGIDPGLIKDFLDLTDKSVLISGGITTRNDLALLKSMGADGVVLGMSIYTGRIDFRKAVREFR